MNKLILWFTFFVLSTTFGIAQVSMEINPTETVVGVGTDQPKFEMDIHHKSGIPTVNSHNGLNLQNKGNLNQNWVLYVNNGIGSLQLYKGVALRGSFDPDTGVYTPTSPPPSLRNTLTLTDQLAVIKRLRPTVYPVNSEKVYGLLAKEVQRVIPDIVSNIAEEGEKANLALSYTELIPILIAAMQEQQALIEDQAEKEASLEAQLESQQAQIEALQTAVAQLVNQSKSPILPSQNIQLEKAYRLGQNPPNPFDQQTTIEYQLPKNTQNASLKITSAMGQMLATYPIQ